jgi:methylated-DNA-[protein]-cysteine S-methyltransferase
MISRSTIDTPIGRLALTASPRGLTRIDLAVDGANVGRAEENAESMAHLRVAERALRAYFTGAPEAFREVIVAPEGTDFQRTVWSALRTIPEGTTLSYRDLAKRIGKPDAVRAVGLANGRNPIPIVVPCHRVIGADRSLTGFGLGVPVKAWLLVHERAAAPFPARVTAATRVVRPASLWEAPVGSLEPFPSA